MNGTVRSVHDHPFGGLLRYGAWVEAPQPVNAQVVIPPGVSLAVLHRADADADYGDRIRDVLQAAGAGAHLQTPSWVGEAGPQDLLPYAGLIYILERDPLSRVASIEAFISVVTKYRRVRPFRLRELIAGVRGPHEVGLVQLILDDQLQRDSATRARLQRLADRLHPRNNSHVPNLVAIYQPQSRYPSVVATVDRYEDPLAAEARAHLQALGITDLDQVLRARHRLQRLTEELEDERSHAASYRPVPGKNLNALALVLTDPEPLRAADGSPVFQDTAERDKTQGTLNRAVATALKALRKESGLEHLDLGTWRGKVEAMYNFYRALNVVRSLGMR